jgi:hypothetical protein
VKGEYTRQRESVTHRVFDTQREQRRIFAQSKEERISSATRGRITQQPENFFVEVIPSSRGRTNFLEGRQG